MHEEYYFGVYEAASAGRAVGAEIGLQGVGAPGEGGPALGAWP